MQYNNNNYIEKSIPIHRIEFTTIGEDEIKKLSVFDNAEGITTIELHSNNEPKKDGLIDKRMGVSSNELICDTCGLSTNYCVGHTGHIELAVPIYHMGYFENVKKILKCVCVKCASLLRKNKTTSLNIKNKNIINETINISLKVKNCPVCNSPVAKIKSEKKTETPGIILSYKTENTKNVSTGKNNDEETEYNVKLSTEEVYSILKNISDEDCYYLSLDPKINRPENMMHTKFLIPPVAIRPSIRGDMLSSLKSSAEDHLTIRLLEIIKTNNQVNKYKNSNNLNALQNLQMKIDSLQMAISCYYDKNSCNNVKYEQKGKALKSISERLKGKSGRIRANLMGKRTDFSSRTVITPDPRISINEVGLPVAIAMNITFPEKVTNENISYLTTLVKNGRNVYPGATYILRFVNGIKKQIRINNSQNISIVIGDVVERHIQTGDNLLINRQPSLHKGSTMAHKAIVYQNPNYATIRLNPAVVHPYNADFDGDEMNGFFAQSIEAVIELEEIADVKYQIITPQSSSPTIGIIWDGLNGAYMLTRDSQKIDWRVAMNILTNTTSLKFDKITKNKIYDGREVYSVIIPERINLYKQDNGKTLVEIKNGNITEGVINNTCLGYGKKNNLIQTILNEYDPDTTVNFINSSVRLTDDYNLFHGFTTGLGDFEVNIELQNKLNLKFKTLEIEIEHDITEYENNCDMLDETLFEYILKNKCGIIDDVSKLVLNNMSDTNNLKIMINAGSKPKMLDMGQIMGCIGQISVAGERAPKTFNGRNLPYFFQNDDRTLARGFVKNSYLKGLNLPEFYFNHYAAREGLIDTSIKTAESGYMQRKLVKATEDFMVKYDGTVRNGIDRIQQFIYGDSGTDTSKQISYSIKFIKLSNEEIKNNYILSTEELNKCQNYSSTDNDNLYNTIIKMRNHMRQTQISSTNDFTSLSDTYMLPSNILMIFNNVKNDETIKDEILYDPKYIIDKIDYILRPDITYLFSMSKEEMENTNSVKYNDEQNAKLAFKYALYDLLNPKKCIINKLSKKHIDLMASKIINSFNKNIAEAGEMVGIIAAQSIGEPLTQMTLNSFHSSGVGGKGASNLGMSRIDEILRISKKLKEPTITIRLDEKNYSDKKYASKIASQIKYTTILDLRNKIELFYESEPYNKDSFMNIDNTTNVFAHKNIDDNILNEMPWLIRIEFDREKLLNKEISLVDIKSLLYNSIVDKNNLKTIKKEKKQLFERITKIIFMSNADNDEIPIIHIRFNVANVTSEYIINFMNNYIDEFNLKGVENINDVYISEEKRITFNDKGEIENKIEYILITSGINLNLIRNLNGVDLKRTFINDILLIYETYGIEAVRNAIIYEVLRVITKGGGADVNLQHVSIFADLMTNMGSLTSINRHGVNKLDTDPLARASFEKTMEILLNASINNETDTMKSVSSRIMAGLTIKGGSTLSSLIIDKKMLENSELTTINNYEQFNEITNITTHEVDENVFIPDF
jgi:DNA-directed RNA polymerase II subunit RPB1